eukprot:10102683-Alexandrium_andersonii.AAC.1
MARARMARARTRRRPFPDVAAGIGLQYTPRPGRGCGTVFSVLSTLTAVRNQHEKRRRKPRIATIRAMRSATVERCAAMCRAAGLGVLCCPALAMG